MIVGAVSDRLDAVVRLVVRGPGGFDEEIEAVIDTGFNEFLTLPPSLTALLALQRVGAIQVTLGDGGTARLPYFPASVLWNDHERTIVVMETDGIPLVGMKLMEGCRLSIDVTEGGSVTIAPLP